MLLIFYNYNNYNYNSSKSHNDSLPSTTVTPEGVFTRSPHDPVPVPNPRRRPSTTSTVWRRRSSERVEWRWLDYINTFAAVFIYHHFNNNAVDILYVRQVINQLRFIFLSIHNFSSYAYAPIPMWWQLGFQNLQPTKCFPEETDGAKEKKMIERYLKQFRWWCNSLKPSQSRQSVECQQVRRSSEENVHQVSEVVQSLS